MTRLSENASGFRIWIIAHLNRYHHLQRVFAHPTVATLPLALGKHEYFERYYLKFQAKILYSRNAEGGMRVRFQN
jgi:hypothetical protein